MSGAALPRLRVVRSWHTVIGEPRILHGTVASLTRPRHDQFFAIWLHLLVEPRFDKQVQPDGEKLVVAGARK